MEESKQNLSAPLQSAPLILLNPTLKSPLVTQTNLLIDKGPTEQIVVWDLETEACKKIIHNRALQFSDSKIDLWNDTQILIATKNKIFSLNIETEQKQQRFTHQEDEEEYGDDIIFFKVIDREHALFSTFKNKVFRVNLVTR